ncbi:MAG: nucleotidyltransferase domain-containing protein [Candidatus Woesearchaeota archaeon]
MNIFQLLTKKNIEILELIDRESLHIRDISDRLNISPGSVHKLIKILRKEDLISETKQKNRIIIKSKKENPIIIEIKRLINLNKLLDSRAYKRLKTNGKIGIYGSFAQGKNDQESDLDLWVYTPKKEIELRPIFRDLEKELSIRVNPLILTKSKIDTIKKNDNEFYLRLKLTSIGDSFD